MNRTMKRHILLLFILPFLCFSQEESETETFMNNLFFDLPKNVSKIQIVNEINKDPSLEKARVAFLGTFSDITENNYLDLSNGSAELLVLYDDTDKKVSAFKIILKKQSDQSNSETIVNLLKSTDVKYKFGQTKGVGNDQHLFWKGENKFAFCAIEIIETPKELTFNGKAEYLITIAYYFENI